MPSKHPESPSGKQPKPQQAAQPEAAASGRKPWKKKTPVEVVLEQGEKLRKEIAELEEEIKRKQRELQKFDEVRKLFEQT